MGNALGAPRAHYLRFNTSEFLRLPYYILIENQWKMLFELAGPMPPHLFPHHGEKWLRKATEKTTNEFQSPNKTKWFKFLKPTDSQRKQFSHRVMDRRAPFIYI